MAIRRKNRISRREFLCRSAKGSAGALAASALACSEYPDLFLPETEQDGGDPETPHTRPNILYFFVDQHRGDALGAMGHPVVQSPNIDRLAGEGVIFGRCYTSGPLCRPARASMMTGLHVHKHGVWNNDQSASPNSTSHVRRLRDEADYLTAVIGKTHLHLGREHLDTYENVLYDWGFTSSLELADTGETAYLRSRYSDWLSSTTTPGEKNKYARYQAYILNYTKNFNLPWLTPPPNMEPWSLRTSDHLDRYTGRMAAEWISNYDDDRPFYLQVNFPGPHDPFDATEDFRSLYDPADPQMPPAILVHPMAPLPSLIEQVVNFQNITAMTALEQRRLAASYFAKISLIDAAVGDVIRALDERGLLRNTWIIYSSDHGEMLGDHYLTQKAVFYEQAVHVPCIVRPPEGTFPWTANGLIDLLDVTATILDIAGLRSGDCAGQSLVPKIEQGETGPTADAGRDWVLSENRYHGMLRTERYKIVADYRQERVVEFYDLEADPQEINNIVDSPPDAKKRDELFEMLRDIVTSDS